MLLKNTLKNWDSTPRETILQSVSGRHKRATDAELQRRVIEVERAI